MKRISILVLFLAIYFCKGIAQEEKYIEEAQVANTLAKGATLYEINDTVKYVYTRPTPFKYWKYAAMDMYQGPKMLFKKESIWPIVGVTASTLALIAVDETVTDKVQQFCNFIGLPGDNKAKNISPIDQLPFYVPVDLASSLYYIGDGITEMAINGGIYAYGLIKNDNRALRTASQLSEGIISVGLWVQILKHVTGRTTAMANNNKDRWRWFPNPITYSKFVPAYDAFPSGHLAIGMTTVTIISLNYPENKYVKPIGYTLLGLCGFQMINNGVHWVSDYPLAIMMGYGFGKLIVNRDRLRVKQRENVKLLGYTPYKPTVKFSPTLLYNGSPGIKFSVKF